MKKIIEVKNLTKKYNKLLAVNKISFNVTRGEIFGLLGENGAGKTTTLEIIEGLRPPTSGTVKIFNKNIKTHMKDIKQRIGVQLQASAYFNFISLKEMLELFGSFYQSYQNPNELLEMINLTDKSKSYISGLSGGQKQRFSIIASLINDPELLFLDEPTTGLDPIARRNLWQIIDKIKQKGKTIVLTTHYMEEAEVLCDRIAIMEQGKILTIGETHKLIEQIPNSFKITFVDPKITKKSIYEISKIGNITKISGKKNGYQIMCKTQKDLNKIISKFDKINLLSLTVGRATLEDVFINLTGKTIKDEENNIH